MLDTFPGVLAFAFVAGLLVLGTLLRAQVSFFRNALVPASLLAGLVGFLLLLFDLDFGFASTQFQGFAFHFFTLSFMSLVLTGSDPGTKKTGSIAPGGLWLATIWTMSLVLQALLGLLVVLAYNGMTGAQLSEFLGIIVTHGFTQGPGQALAMGNIWEHDHGITNAISFGVIYASAGFVAAFVVGVPVARWAVQKGLNANTSARLDKDFIRGWFAPERRESAGQQITHPANVDSLAMHIGILGIAYLLTDAWLNFIGPIAATVSLGESNLGLMFSHNLFFLHGLMVCVLLRKLMDRFGLGQFIDNNTQRRITGSAVDFMVVATLLAVQVSLLAEFWLPILLVCLTVAAGTALLCFSFGRLLGQYGVERALTLYGCCCGSTGSGIVLLRILDPDLSTPIARELAFFNVAVIVTSLHILGFMAPLLPTFSWPVLVGVYGGTFLLGALIAIVGFKRLKRTSGQLDN